MENPLFFKGDVFIFPKEEEMEIVSFFWNENYECWYGMKSLRDKSKIFRSQRYLIDHLKKGNFKIKRVEL